MAPHSSTLAWKIPWTEGWSLVGYSGGVEATEESVGSQRVGLDWSDLAHMHGNVSNRWRPALGETAV